MRSERLMNDRFNAVRAAYLRINPAGPGIRLDSGVYPGWTVPLDYDPLLAKLAVWAATREEAIARMTRALDEYHVVGIKTNLGLFRQLLANDEFQRGKLHTGFIDEFLKSRGAEREQPAELNAVAALVAYAYLSTRRDAANHQAVGVDGGVNPWLAAGRDELLPESEGEKADDPHSTAPQEKSMAKRLSRDRTIPLPEICKTLNISKATLYGWVNAGGGNVAKP